MKREETEKIREFTDDSLCIPDSTGLHPHFCFWKRALSACVSCPACGKSHEEGGFAYAKAGSSLRSPPGNSRASTPKTRVCLLYCFVLSPTPLTLRGLSPTTISLLNRFFGPHVIVQSLPTVRGMRCSKLSKYRFF